MKINKNQALYKGLPNSWISFSKEEDSSYKYACRVLSWNTRKVDGIYEEKIINDIKRRIDSFKKAGGDIGDFNKENLSEYLDFCEAVVNPDFGDINCKISPALFYCNICHRVISMKKATERPNCECSGKKIKMQQLQMIYSCECGYADGIWPPKSGNLFYEANKTEKSAYHFIRVENGKRYTDEIFHVCTCGRRLYPKNATDKKNFNPQSGKNVNLFSEKLGELLKKHKTETENLIIAKWLGIITESEYKDILNKPESYYDLSENHGIPEDLINNLMNKLHISKAEAIGYLSDDTNDKNAEGIALKLNQIYTANNSQDLLASSLIEYDTLLYPKSVIGFDEAVKKSLMTSQITCADELLDLNKKLGISFIQVSQSVKIVNYSYGYTRMSTIPTLNSTRKLVLKAFNDYTNKYKVFTNILETEGIIIEFDRKKIYQWLIDNNICNGDYSFDSVEKEKLFYMENINLDAIVPFMEIESGNAITKAVYSLLHSMAHMFIQSAGVNSGLSKDSLSEIIFPNVPAIFIYPTTIQGITLGSISGMFETNYLKFMSDTLEMNEICTFDPICMQNQNGACLACSYISDVSCTHFNQDLSRAYLYGGEISYGSNKKRKIKGFWK